MLEEIYYEGNVHILNTSSEMLRKMPYDRST